MLFEHKHINYSNNYEIVKDGRLLRAFKNKDFIIDYDKNFKYIDSYNKSEFFYKNELYKIKFFDGCFNPFVIKIIK